MGTDGKLHNILEIFQTAWPPPHPSSQPLAPSSALSYQEARSDATSALEASVKVDGLEVNMSDFLCDKDKDKNKIGSIMMMMHLVANKVSNGRAAATANNSSANLLIEVA